MAAPAAPLSTPRAHAAGAFLLCVGWLIKGPLIPQQSR